MSGGNHHSNKKYWPKLAVSVTSRFPNSWTEITLRDCINSRLRRNSDSPAPVVICQRTKHGERDEYYVELRTEGHRDRLLNLNETTIEFGPHSIRPFIEPWERPSASSSSNQADRRNNNDSWNQRQSGKKTILQRDTVDGNTDSRPLKRQRATMLTSQNNNQNRSPSSKINVIGNDVRSGQTSTPSSTTHNQSPRQSEKTSSRNSTENCKIYLVKKPSGYTPESFLDYLNRQIETITSIAGFSSDESGENSKSKCPVLTCYESSSSTIHDGWVLETKTERIADKIIVQLNGKLILSGTRLYFKRHPTFSNDIAKDTNGKHPLKITPSPSTPLPNWRNYACLIYMSKTPSSMSPKEVLSFINTFLIKAGRLDRDAIIDWRSVGKFSACSFLCVSAEAAQGIIDVVNDVDLKGIKLKFTRHKSILEQKTNDKASNDTRRMGSPLSAKNTISKIHSPSGNITSPSLTSASKPKGNRALRSMNPSTPSRYLLLYSRKNDTIRLSKVMTFLEEAISDGSRSDHSAIIGAERCTSSSFRLEVDTAENASKLVKLSGIMYNNTQELILKKEEEENFNVALLATENRPTAVSAGAQASGPHNIQEGIGTDANDSSVRMFVAIEDNAQLKQRNDNLTKQVLKLLKENKEMKKRNQASVSSDTTVKLEQISRGSDQRPIELENSSDEEVEKTSSQSETRKEELHKLKRQFKAVILELEKCKTKKRKLENDLVTAKDNFTDLERKVEETKKEVNDDYERRLHEIHESWREQNSQIQEQQECIDSLKTKQEQQLAEKERLTLQLEDNKRRYQDMTDALTRSTVIIQEEMAVRKSMALSLVELRKAKKKAEKELKGFKRHNAKMKAEGKYDV